MNKPRVSVVMAVYNSERYLTEAIDSLLSQTLGDFEFIIVDDGSFDGSGEIIRAFDDSRIRLKRQENKGLAAALNSGIAMARGVFVARMDADDHSLPERLLEQVEFLDAHPEVVAVGSAAIIMDADGCEICVFRNPEEDTQLRHRFPTSPFVHPSVMFRLSAFLSAGGYPEYMKHGGEDIVLFSAMAKQGQLSNLQSPLIRYRITPGSISRKPKTFRRELKKIISDVANGTEAGSDALKQLEISSVAIPQKESDFSYHYDLARYYIWSGQGFGRARKHLAECRKLYPFRPTIWQLYLLAIMPPRLINSAYMTFRRTNLSKR